MTSSDDYRDGYAAGQRNGRTEATIEDVRGDIRALDKKIEGMLQHCGKQCQLVAALNARVIGIAGATVAGFAWLCYLTFK